MDLRIKGKWALVTNEEWIDHIIETPVIAHYWGEIKVGPLDTRIMRKL